jgi:hypothetical protein
MKQIIINPDSSFFPIFCKAIKTVEYPKKELSIKVLNREKSMKNKKNIFNYYKFIFDWQDDNNNICSVDVFEKDIKNE